jgi:hypothetical protein
LVEYRRLQMDSHSEEEAVQLYRATAATAARPSRGWHRPKQNWAADFVLLGKRAVTTEQWLMLWRVGVLGQDPLRAAASIGIPAGARRHVYYRAQALAGQAYAETRPYGIWPVSAYYATSNQLEHDTGEAYRPWRMAA